MTEIRFTLPSIYSVMDKVLSRLTIGAVIAVSAILRFFTMSFPSDGGMIFDEVHYIKAVRALMAGIPANGEHPPLTKLIGLVSIRIFGDHWFAWRFPIVLLSLLGTYAIYLVAKDWLGDEKRGVLAAALFSFDIIWFIHGNIFMLEAPALAFSLLFIYYYQKKRSTMAALAMSLGFLCNEKALFVLLGVAIYHVWTYPRKREYVKPVATFLGLCILFGGGGLWINDLVWTPIKDVSVQTTANVVVMQNDVGVPVTTSTVLRTLTSGTPIRDPFTHFIFMVTYYTGLNSAIPQETATWRPPWSWIGPFGDNWNNPPTYFKTTVTYGDKTDALINYQAQSTFPIWWMTLPIITLSFYEILVRKIDVNRSKFMLSLLAGTYGWWVLWELPKMNIPFNHYMMFAIPGLCIGIPWFWSRISPKYANYITLTQLAVTVMFFFMYFPVLFVRTF